MERYLPIGTLRKLNVRIIIDDNIDNPIYKCINCYWNYSISNWNIFKKTNKASEKDSHNDNKK